MKKFVSICKKIAAAALGLCFAASFLCACAPAAGDIMDVSPSPVPTSSAAQPADPTPTPTPTPVPAASPATATELSALPGEKTPSPYAGEKLVALTFDDGPFKTVTSRILDAVERYSGDGVHVTFFVLGLQVVQYPELVSRAHDLGCEIGNHTYHHTNLTRVSLEEMQKEVFDLVEMIEEITGVKPTLVRPPYGAKDETVYENVPFPLIMWNIDTLDWQTHDTQSTVDSALNAKDGDIILMHDVREDTAAAVERIIPGLLERGFKLVTVSEMFEAKGIELKAGQQYRKAR